MKKASWNQQLVAIYHKGLDAYSAGKTLADNPYFRGDRSGTGITFPGGNLQRQRAQYWSAGWQLGCDNNGLRTSQTWNIERKATVKTKTVIEIKYVRISVPVNYGEVDIPNDFPFRDADTWNILVEIDTGQIVDWPADYKISEYDNDNWLPGDYVALHMQVVDGGTYKLLDKDHKVLASLEQDYVPHGVVPGDFGDYLGFRINRSGIIDNWPKQPDVSEFFKPE